MSVPRPASAGCLTFDGAAAVARLSGYGLRPERFVSAFRHGHDRQVRCAPTHPRTYRGVVMWAETVAQLRTELLDLNVGWRSGYSRNYETVFRPEIGMAIAVVAGDVNTGVRGLAPPRTARRHGPVTANRVLRNAVQGELPLDLPDSAARLGADELCATWFFLLKARQDTMFSELSLPRSIGPDGRVEGWAERIIFDPVPLAGAVTPVSSGDDDETPIIHVERI